MPPPPQLTPRKKDGSRKTRRDQHTTQTAKAWHNLYPADGEGNKIRSYNAANIDREPVSSTCYTHIPPPLRPRLHVTRTQRANQAALKMDFDESNAKLTVCRWRQSKMAKVRVVWFKCHFILAFTTELLHQISERKSIHILESANILPNIKVYFCYRRFRVTKYQNFLQLPTEQLYRTAPLFSEESTAKTMKSLGHSDFRKLSVAEPKLKPIPTRDSYAYSSRASNLKVAVK